MHSIVIATYNLWGLMFNWQVRRLYISEMIRDTDADVVALQDVCIDGNKRNQLDEMQSLLPEYTYKRYMGIDSHLLLYDGCQERGLGILSKHAITNTITTNGGAFLHLQLSLQPCDYELGVMTMHWSEDRKQQCKATAQILEHLYTYGVENIVLLGDFNADEHFTWPTDALLNGKFDTTTPEFCRMHGRTYDNEKYRGYGYLFHDVWTTMYPLNKGLTFSNLPNPDFVSRPNRILVSNVGLNIKSAVLLGRGDFYTHKYRTQLWWHRLFLVVRYMQSDRKLQCGLNCGDHAICRCGVCIPNTSELRACPTCNICSMGVYRTVNLLFLYAFLAICVLLFACFLVLADIQLLKFKGSKKFINVNRILTTLFRLMRRKGMLFLLLVTLCIDLWCLRFLLNPLLLIVNAHTEAELRPSDHLMVVAKVLVS